MVQIIVQFLFNYHIPFVKWLMDAEYHSMWPFLTFFYLPCLLPSKNFMETINPHQ